MMMIYAKAYGPVRIDINLILKLVTIQLLLKHGFYLPFFTTV